MKKTAYLHLPIYEDLDMQDLRDGYNVAVKLLDRKAQELDFKIEQLRNKE